MKIERLLIWALWLMPFLGISQPIEKACFSVSGGFYETSPTLEIFPFYQHHHIRFTTNGNRPTAHSQLYTDPLLLDESLYSTSDIYTIVNCPEQYFFLPDSIAHCIVIRAAVFDDNDSCISPVTTNSYFIHALGCDTHGLPVVSLCADSLDLFDEGHGIFVPGAHFDPQDPDWTGNYYQTGDAWERMSNVEFYELNNDGINQEAGLRTHGGNGRRFQQKSVKLYARKEYGKKRFDHRFFENIPQSSFKHLVLKPFMSSWNYTGINDHISNQVASQLNVESLASRPVLLFLNGEYWGIYFIHEKPDEYYLKDHLDVDMDDVNIISSWAGKTDCGSPTSFLSLSQWVATADLNDYTQLEDLETRIDIDCFIDYQILELFLENTDWPANNMRCWQEGNGKWRWMFFDGDACVCWNTFYTFDNAVYEGDEIWPSSSNATLFFRKLLQNQAFCQRFHDRFLELVSTTFSYDNTGPMFEQIKSQLASEIPFQSDRFHFPATVETWHTSMGSTQWTLMKRCETIVPELENFLIPWSIAENNAHSSVFPNPFTNQLTMQFNSPSSGTTKLQVFNVLGQEVYSKPLALTSGDNEIVVNLSLAPGFYLLKTDFFAEKVIRR